MSDKDKSIDELLADFELQKKKRVQRELEELEPPKRREELIDFSKPEDETENTEKEKVKKSSRKKTDFDIKKHLSVGRQSLKKLAKAVTQKKVLMPIGAVVLVIVLAVTVPIAVKAYKQNQKIAYLKPYIEKYPDVTFPEGILEKYCDAYGADPEIYAHIKIDDINLDTMITKQHSEVPADGAVINNYVVYLDDDSLENIYKDAAACNSSSKSVSFSDLYDEYTFQVVGAFYTNTKPEDDNGYVFPYNTCEKLEPNDASTLINGIKNRFRYKSVDFDIDRSDKLLTISCPTDYREDYRFVLVCKAVDKVNAGVQAGIIPLLILLIPNIRSRESQIHISLHKNGIRTKNKIILNF